eukprot:TRINITY_DN7325_c0_g1_i1.p1 TRINITY_DN7325_c0_g1~~TRINITY_DN7325_c0_g1_i1.p1  ORF type:complete len:183 (-),score=37.31 TRINITY_DN7325_c0_g1_i1:166-714(-)
MKTIGHQSQDKGDVNKRKTDESGNGTKKAKHDEIDEGVVGQICELSGWDRTKVLGIYNQLPAENPVDYFLDHFLKDGKEHDERSSSLAQTLAEAISKIVKEEFAKRDTTFQGIQQMCEQLVGSMNSGSRSNSDTNIEELFTRQEVRIKSLEESNKTLLSEIKGLKSSVFAKEDPDDEFIEFL